MKREKRWKRKMLLQNVWFFLSVVYVCIKCDCVVEDDVLRLVESTMVVCESVSQSK
jgi:hypothetical protein